jgi:quinol monooxygenase YgiN
MLINAVIYTFPPESADTAEELLRALRDASRAESGCIAYDVARGIDDPTVFVLHEVWRDHAALEAHYAEEHFTRLGLAGIRPLATERIGHRCREI